MKLILSLLATVMFGVGAIYLQTDGFTAVTTETARRNSIAQQPRPVPDAQLDAGDGVDSTLLHMLKADGRVTIIDFIYTRCMSICRAMGSDFQQLQAYIEQNQLGNRVRLLSISFDPADDAKSLNDYAKSMKADSRYWQFVMPTRQNERQALLETFGITVIPTELGQFEHNAAYHIVTPDGRLSRVVDFTEPRLALIYSLSLRAAISAAAAIPSPYSAVAFSDSP